MRGAPAASRLRLTTYMGVNRSLDLAGRFEPDPYPAAVDVQPFARFLSGANSFQGRVFGTCSGVSHARRPVAIP